MPPMDREQQYHLWYFVAAFMGLLFVQSWLSGVSVTEHVPYSTFLQHLEKGHIASVTVRTEEIKGNRCLGLQGEYMYQIERNVREKPAGGHDYCWRR